MVRNYKLINNLLGWIVCIIASAVYILTAEPTVSFWDCGEYIATAYKLQVGHPPGAPTFQLIGRIFSMFAGDDVTKVAFCVNVMSALCSGFTILFLFWSITMFAKKMALLKGESELTVSKTIAIFGSGLIGALAYTFTDTFWFSAVEGEVYAMSSFFTALVFWAILKWESVADQNYSYRWLVLIAYLIGLSIGVHLLNLLTLPAMVLVVYFKKYKPSTKGLIYAFLLSFVMVGLILWGIIPGIVKYSSVFERLFVNSFKLPFNSGTIFYFAAIIALVVWGIIYSEKNKKRLLNIILLSFTFIVIGYSSFLVLVIRSNANTPIDENNPNDAVALLAYLNREQYGSTPLIYGNYYNAPVIGSEDEKPVYIGKYFVVNKGVEFKSFFTKTEAQNYIKENKEKNPDLKIKDKYVIGDPKKNMKMIYDPKYCTLFPRMYSREDAKVRNYKEWAGIKPDATRKPTFSENLKFFFNYQMWYMYGRYFMWNFAGRQTVNQGFGSKTSGEWISGITFIDEARLGPQNLPEHMENKGRNAYYFLPLLLGLIGLVYQFKKDWRNWTVVLALFFMTGIAIAIYLNMYAYQPRERDYAFAASFYAFAMWIGLGVYAIYEFAKKYMNKNTAAIASTVVCTSVPAILAAQNWDDHNRSNRYLTREIAKMYLDSCEPNAILFTNGDNDTFPLWYMQEVEEYRTDVRIFNLSLAGTDWYLDQMKRQAYDGLPVPMKMTKEMYQSGQRDLLVAQNQIKTPQNLVNVMKKDIMYNPNNNKREPFIKTMTFALDVDRDVVMANGTVSLRDTANIVDKIIWTMPKESLYQTNGVDTVLIVSKAYIAMMDILAHNNWERPIYFASTMGPESYFGLQKYLQLEGSAYRLVPVEAPPQEYSNQFYGRVNSEVLYKNLTEKFNLSEYANPEVYLSEDYTRSVQNFKITFLRLAEQLALEGDSIKAEEVIDLCYTWFPKNTIPYDIIDNYLGDTYIRCNTATSLEKGLTVLSGYVDILFAENNYYAGFKGKKAEIVNRKNDWNKSVLSQMGNMAMFYQSQFPDYSEKFGELAEKISMGR